ncbi:Pumilio RNA-binding repeat [Dillenia turbinata]|uniref:Pumilio RNA-binding repeat n=1 Tax=Dillenia turbinata TaxID=194707 RepID=A0AAN8YT70_9MAGN
MVAIGSKALPLPSRTTANNTTFSLRHTLAEEEYCSYNSSTRMKGMRRKPHRKTTPAHQGSDTRSETTHTHKKPYNPHVRYSIISLSLSHSNELFVDNQQGHAQKTKILSYCRKQMDDETVKYFTEIANLFDSGGLDGEEPSVLCGNALEEARGKEVQLATDHILSHTLQKLLEGCDLDHLCAFLRGCAQDFPWIAIDVYGSYVAETALKALALHLEETGSYSLIHETLTTICQVIAANSVDVMCSRSGSHCLRSLLCLCRGAPLDASGFHSAKSSTILAERLNLRESESDNKNLPPLQHGFPDLLKLLVTGMLHCCREDLTFLKYDQCSSLVLQAALKLLVGHDQELLNSILILLGCDIENITQGYAIEATVVQEIKEYMKETAYSHLMEVILEVAPKSLYEEIFTKIFRNSLFEISSHHCGNFVIQALVCHARSQGQMELIWEELGSKVKHLLELGRSGVVASLIAASRRLKTNEHKWCQVLASAVCSANESPECIVPRILFLESYFNCKDKSNWKWGNGAKIYVMGSLILQSVFGFPSEFIQPFITSITTMDDGHVFEAAKDAGGARAIEAFLTSNASGKSKRRFIVKLKGRFAELSIHPSGSFVVEKCFSSSNVPLREVIASELLTVQNELSKMKQGPHLLRRLDINGFAARPDQWKLRQASKQSTYKEFFATFGSKEQKSSSDNFLSDKSNPSSHAKKLKKMRKEINDSLAPRAPSKFLSHNSSEFKHHFERGQREMASSKRNLKRKQEGGRINNPDIWSEQKGSIVSSDRKIEKEKKRKRKDGLGKSSTKKMKT